MKNLELVEISWTSGSIDEARRISRHLVQGRLVANARIIPWVETVSLLDNRLDIIQESKVILTACMGCLDKIREIIETHSKYDIPEIVWRKIDGGNKPYVDWINETLKQC